MQVLGIGHEHQEPPHHRHLRQQEHRLQHAVDPAAQRRQPVPHQLRGERAVRVGEIAGVDLRAAGQQQRGDDQENTQQHQPRRTRVTAGKPRRPALPARVLPQPDHRERDDPGQHRHREQVLGERDERPVIDARELLVEQVPVGLDDRQQQHGETPERERMRQARHRPPQQLPLPHHLGQLSLRIPPGMRAHRRDPLRRRLPSPAHPPQPPQPPARQGKRRHRQNQPHHDPHNHESLLMRHRADMMRAAPAASVRRALLAW